MRILIQLTGKAFLPEVPAYRTLLSNGGHTVDVAPPEVDISATSADVVIRFGGLLRANENRTYKEIHEYHNVSQTFLPRSRNFLKRHLSGTPDGRIFVTQWVRDEFRFNDQVPYRIRQQGASPDLLRVRTSRSPEFDLVYCGSVSGRPGLIREVRRLAAAGLSIGVAGSATPSDISKLNTFKGVHFVGMLRHDEVPGFLARGRFALHYCPDQYPFRYQFSTKLAEYLVAGLPIVSNSYPWVDQFSASKEFSYINIGNVKTPSDLLESPRNVISKSEAKALTWPAVLERADIVGLVEQVVGN